MAWIESHQSLGTHPKLIDFAERLGVSWPTAVGHLQYLWWWALDGAPNGEVKLKAPALATVMYWTNDPAILFTALVDSGWLEKQDDHFVIHDWDDYAGKLIGQRKRDTLRQRAYRQSIKQDMSRVTSHTTSRVTLDGTVPNPTVPIKEESKEEKGDGTSKIVSTLMALPGWAETFTAARRWVVETKEARPSFVLAHVLECRDWYEAHEERRQTEGGGWEFFATKPKEWKPLTHSNWKMRIQVWMGRKPPERSPLPAADDKWRVR